MLFIHAFMHRDSHGMGACGGENPNESETIVNGERNENEIWLQLVPQFLFAAREIRESMQTLCWHQFPCGRFERETSDWTSVFQLELAECGSKNTTNSTAVGMLFICFDKSWNFRRVFSLPVLSIEISWKFTFFPVFASSAGAKKQITLSTRLTLISLRTRR